MFPSINLEKLVLAKKSKLKALWTVTGEIDEVSTDKPGQTSLRGSTAPPCSWSLSRCTAGLGSVEY